VLASAIRALDQASKLLSDENIGKVSAILANLQAVSGTVAESDGDIKQTIAQAREAMERLNRIAGNLETMSAQDLPATLADFRQTANNFQQLSRNLDEMVAENRPAVSNFASTALPEIGQFATEARRAAASLNRVLERIEAGPAEFIFPPKTPQIEAPRQ